jgi:hypothetical protein
MGYLSDRSVITNISGGECHIIIPDETAETGFRSYGFILSDVLAAFGLDYITQSEKGQPLGIPILDENGIVYSSFLPNYIDELLGYANLAAFPATGQSNKIYLALDTEIQYRWSGAVYAAITSGAVISVNGQTGAVNLTTANINDSTNKRYSTDAEKTKISNLSGTNTGDETEGTILAKLGISTLSGSNTGDQDLSDLAVSNHNHDLVYQPLKGVDDFYITAFQKAILSQTSGTNTGNQIGDGVTILGTGTSGDPFYVSPNLIGLEEVVELITFASSNPSGTIGQKYYNTSTKKILTYTTSWGGSVDPVVSILYVVIDTDTLYRWTGSTMVSVGGSGAQIQSDWNQTNNALADFIKNKPNIPSISGLLDETAHDQLDHTGLTGIPAAQIQSDWNQASNAALDYIKNKPSIPGAFDLPATIHAATTLDTINDNDEFDRVDSVNSNTLKKTTWSNIKSKLKTYFDTIFSSIVWPLETWHYFSSTAGDAVGDIRESVQNGWKIIEYCIVADSIRNGGDWIIAKMELTKRIAASGYIDIPAIAGSTFYTNIYAPYAFVNFYFNTNEINVYNEDNAAYGSLSLTINNNLVRVSNLNGTLYQDITIEIWPVNIEYLGGG